MRDPFDPNFGSPQPWRLKVAVAVVSLLLMVVAAAACGGNDNFTRYGQARKTNVHGIYEASQPVRLADGRTVDCLVLSKEFSAADDHHAIAISCDWDHAK